MTWCTDVLADKPQSRFDTKLLSKEVWFIRQCLRYAFTFDSAVSSKILTSSDTDDSSLVKIHWKNLCTNILILTTVIMITLKDHHGSFVAWFIVNGILTIVWNKSYHNLIVAYLPASLPKIPPIKPTHSAIFSLSSGCPL